MSGVITALFMRQRRLDSLALRTFMWSPWSHVAVVVPGGYVIDATFFKGVARRSLGPLVQSASQHEFRSYEVPDASAGYAFAYSQVGKPYDWKGVVGIGVHKEWQDDSAWFCSEFLEAVLAKAGRQRFHVNVGRVTPQHSWMVV